MKKRIFLTGDSTVQSYGPEAAPITGWGQMLYEHFKGSGECKSYRSPDSDFEQSMCYELEDVIIDNRAMAGRSSRSFREEGRLADIEKCIRPGDYMLIQFAHNDSNKAKPERYVKPEDYGRSIGYFTELCREKGATAVLVTAIAMRNCDDSPDGDFGISFPEYREAMMRFAAEEKLPLLDMGKATTEYCRRLGPEKTKELFLWVKPGEYPDGPYKDGNSDNAHLQRRGAFDFSRILTELVKQSADGRLDELKGWLK